MSDVLTFAARVLRLVDLTDSRLPQSGCNKLELSLLSFFEQFRKIYIGDQVQKTSRVSNSNVELTSSFFKTNYVYCEV